VIGRVAGGGAWMPIFIGCAVAYVAAQVLVVALLPDLGRIRTLPDSSPGE